MAAFSSFARLPMLRACSSVCSLMHPFSLASHGGPPCGPRLPGSGRRTVRLGRPGGLPSAGELVGAHPTAVGAGGHRDVVAETANGAGPRGADQVGGGVRRAHGVVNANALHRMPRAGVASTTAAVVRPRYRRASTACEASRMHAGTPTPRKAA